MKSKLISAFILMHFGINGFGQVQIQWQKCFGGTSDEYAYSIQQTSDGGYVLAGSAYSNDGDVSGNLGMEDFWITKLDFGGNLQWQKCLGGVEDEKAFSAQQTVDGGFIVAGWTTSFNTDANYLVFKLDASGNVEWQDWGGGPDNDYVKAIQQTSDGGYIMAGKTESTYGGVSGNHGGYDFWVVKTDNLGDVQWQKCFGGVGGEEACSIQQTSDGGYVVAGFATSNTDDVSGNHGGGDFWVVKLDDSGNMQWQKCLGGTEWDFVYSVQQTREGGFVLAGFTESFNGDVSGYHGGKDCWIVKLDGSGNLEWQKCLGGTALDWAYSIQQTNGGGYIVAGYTFSTDGDVLGNNGGDDYWLVKLDSLGELEWQKCLGGMNSDVARSIEICSDGGFIVAGYVYSNDSYVFGNHGSLDQWIVKFLEPNISGFVYQDQNSNGIKDSSEQGVAGHLVQLNPGSIYTFTNNDGHYYFRGDTGIAYTVSYIPHQYWYETSNNYQYNVALDSLSQWIDTLDFGVVCGANENDVSVYITGSPTRANFDTHFWLTYKNWGTVTASGTIEFQYDPLLTYQTSFPLTPVSHVGNILTFDYDTLGPGVQRMLRLDFQVPGVQYLGDTLHSYAMITPLVPDTFVTNNYDTLEQVITGSFDPNDKSVRPEGLSTDGYVLHGERLTYTIRFQNTGTDTAFTVVIRDTLDTDLDIETFVVEANSHPVSWQLHSGNELFFTFQNINLPDSNVNEPGSHGFIRYSISPKPGLADNTTATNTAYIFFDYNPAIVTNTTLNTYVTIIPTGTSDAKQGYTSNAYPNPSSETIYINLPEFTRKIEVYNSSGEKVKELVPQRDVAEIGVKDLPAGLYVVRMYGAKGVVSTKFIKE